MKAVSIIALLIISTVSALADTVEIRRSILTPEHFISCAIGLGFPTNRPIGTDARVSIAIDYSWAISGRYFYAYVGYENSMFEWYNWEYREQYPDVVIDPDAHADVRDNSLHIGMEIDAPIEGSTVLPYFRLGLGYGFNSTRLFIIPCLGVTVQIDGNIWMTLDGSANLSEQSVDASALIPIRLGLRYGL